MPAAWGSSWAAEWGGELIRLCSAYVDTVRADREAAISLAFAPRPGRFMHPLVCTARSGRAPQCDASGNPTATGINAASPRHALSGPDGRSGEDARELVVSLWDQANDMLATLRECWARADA